jgi:hypothetical protein
MTSRLPLGMLRIATLLAAMIAAAGCQRPAEAQEVTRDPLGPLRCYQLADDAELASDTAIDLCAGALSDAPGGCYLRAVDQFPSVATQKLQILCAGATSLEPLACFTQLDAQEELTEDQMVTYCATACPLAPPPPEASSAACLDLALEQTELTLQQAGELCALSSSAGPVQCYLAGDANNPELSDSNLIRLCAEQFGCQYRYQAGAPATAPAY